MNLTFKSNYKLLQTAFMYIVIIIIIIIIIESIICKLQWIIAITLLGKIISTMDIFAIISQS